MIEILLDCVIDTVKLLPFLFLTYLLMEVIEHKTSDRTRKVIRRAGKWGPLFGGVLGMVPQCGFSAAAAGFYSGRVITVGTLIAVFLSTSDEMLPILLSNQAPLSFIIRIMVLKAVIGVAAGFVIDLLFRRFNQRKIGAGIHDFCRDEHCHCETSILGSALSHTISIAFFLLIVNALLNLVLGVIGEENLGSLILNQPVISELLAGVIGLIPNCAASVVLTSLYLEGAMSAGALTAGLLVGAGAGLLILFRTNKSRKESLKITGLLYVTGVLGGIIVDLCTMI